MVTTQPKCGGPGDEVSHLTVVSHFGIFLIFQRHLDFASQTNPKSLEANDNLNVAVDDS